MKKVLTALLAIGLVACQDDAQPSNNQSTSSINSQSIRLAAEQGNATAQRRIAFLSLKGEGVPRDIEQAVKWYRLAAEQGNTDAQTNLGLLYEEGKGVPTNRVKAYSWFSIAASQGHTESESHRERVVKEMTKKQIAAAQSLSTKCFESNYKDCD